MRAERSVKRTRITDRTLLAHCLSRLLEIPHSHQVLLHEDQMISLAERDHWPVPVAEGGTNHFSNVWARPIREHREKTSKIDVPGIAKRKRIRRKEAEHQAARAWVTERLADPPSPRKSQWAKRKLQSRRFQKRRA
jgi:hypothetical protein